jgi:carboxylesterase
MQGAEPFFFPGGEIGCLCLHGVTASPAEVTWLGRYLSEQGLSVYGPRLAGHGVHPQQLRHLRWQDWYLSALDGYHLLRERCEQVYVAGLSMGGLLTLVLGASVPVDGLVVMAAPVIFQNPRRLAMARWLKYLRPILHMPDTSGFEARLLEAQKRRGEPPIGRVRYDDWATQAIEELKKLADTANALLPQITIPTLLLYSEADSTVALANRDHIRARLGSTLVETHTFQKSGHILTQDIEYQQVLERAGKFILKISVN